MQFNKTTSKLKRIDDMELPQSLEESSTAISGPTANSEPCYQFTSDYFETGSSTAPYLVNASLNVALALLTTMANILVLSAIRKNTALHLPSRLLLVLRGRF